MTAEQEVLESTAVRNLTALGLSEYAARTLVALTRIGSGSAREVSEASSVPRTRVYDAVEELSNRGFVRIEQTHPKVFTPRSPRRIRRNFFREYVFRLVLAEWGLRAFGSHADDPSHSEFDFGVGRDVVQARFIDAIDRADDQLMYVTVGQPISDEVIATLQDVSERDVGVRIVGVDEFDPASVREALPESTVMTVSDVTVPPTCQSRFLLVDETLAFLGTWSDSENGGVEIGLFSERPSTGVALLLTEVVETLVADAE